MEYFTIKKSIFLVPTPYMEEEYRKIDKFMKILENSGVAKILKSVNKKDENCKGRKGYNPYNLFAAIVYCFSICKATLRDIENKFMFDVRTIYIMENQIPKHTIIGEFINKYIVLINMKYSH